ncbi:hypothetical protein FRC12_023277 [Ceratobasidium sp. 428]|nr:hypothetical protein FRC12_023277 [Ceratobasidium sp. 428]
MSQESHASSQNSEPGNPVTTAIGMIEVVINSFEDQSKTDFSNTELTKKQSESLDTAWDFTETLGKQLKHLKHKLVSVGYGKSKKAKRQHKQDLLGQEEHTGDLWEQTESKTQDMDQFFAISFDASTWDAITLVHYGFSNALVKTDISLDVLSKFIECLCLDSSLAKVMQVCTSTPLTCSIKSLCQTYDAIMDPHGPLNLHGGINWLQYICQILQLLWLVLQ